MRSCATTTSKTIHTDFRIIATATEDINSLMSSGNIMPELYYRLTNIEFALPSCAERPSDIPLLADHIIEQYCMATKHSPITYGRDVRAEFERYDWPGNVRELGAAIRSACDLCRFGRITLQDLPPSVLSDKTKTMGGRSFSSIGDLQSMKEQQIKTALSLTNNNIAEAAQLLGMGRSTLYKYLNRLDANR